MCVIGQPINSFFRPKNRPLVMYRAFTYHSDGNLYPLHYAYRYKDGWNETNPPAIGGGWPGSEQGFWGFNQENKDQVGNGSGYRVHAKVKIAGTIVKHTGGYRAQYMKITHLTPTSFKLTNRRMFSRYPSAKKIDRI